MTPPQVPMASQAPSSRNAVVPKKPPPKLKNETSWSAVPCEPPDSMSCRCELLTDEFSCTKLNTLRRLSGISVTIFVETSAPRLALSVCSRGAAAVTSICSTEPMDKVMVWLADWPTSNVIPVCRVVLKPAASTDKVYVPAGSSAKEKLPSESLLNVRVIPFSGLVRVTLALAMRAPEESETEPENEAVEASVWPWATGAPAQSAKQTTRHRSVEKRQNLGIDRDPFPKYVIGNCTEV